MIFSVAYTLPVIAALVFADGTVIKFLASALLTLGVGLLIALLTRNHRRELKSRDGFLLVTLAWITMSAMSAVPFLLTIRDLGFTDAFFEATSGLTTTGSTILTGLDALPPAINLWRHTLHWLGGLGIIVLALAILPLLGVGGMQLYKAEAPGAVKDSKLTPRITETAKALWLTYAGLTAACTLAFWVAGMSWFDAICHAFSTLSLGGFSTHDASIGYFDSVTIECVAMFFMVLAAMNFTRHFIAIRRFSLQPYRSDPEIHAVLALLAGSIVLVAVVVHLNGHYDSWLSTLRHTAFSVISISTTQGYATENYEAWPAFVGYWLLFLSCITCSMGSTGGGIKMFRTLLLRRQAFREMRQMVHPQAVEPMRIGSQVVPNRIAYAVLAFIFLYFMTVVILTFAMLLSGLDIVSSFSAVIASINNMGPGMGRVGPSTTYQGLSDFQTWVCSVAMFLGRLEIFSVLVLFTPTFWRK